MTSTGDGKPYYHVTGSFHECRLGSFHGADRTGRVRGTRRELPSKSTTLRVV